MGANKPNSVRLPRLYSCSAKTRIPFTLDTCPAGVARNASLERPFHGDQQLLKFFSHLKAATCTEIPTLLFSSKGKHGKDFATRAEGGAPSLLRSYSVLTTAGPKRFSLRSSAKSISELLWSREGPLLKSAVREPNTKSNVPVCYIHTASTRGKHPLNDQGFESSAALPLSENAS